MLAPANGAPITFSPKLDQMPHNCFVPRLKQSLQRQLADGLRHLVSNYLTLNVVDPLEK